MSSPSTIAPAQPPSNPWKALSATTAPRSPTMQEILDEELARQLHELELQQVAKQYEAYAVTPISTTVEYTDLEAEDQANADDSDDYEAVEDDEPDYDYDDADIADDIYLSKSLRARGGGRRGRDADAGPTNIQLTGTFDDRTRWVLGKLAGRGILNAVNSRLRSSLSASIHLGTNDLAVEGVDEKIHQVYAVKVLKLAPIDRPPKVAENVKFHGRPMDEEMLWMSMRRQLKIRMDREHSAQTRAIACGVRAAKPVCSWEHVMVMEFIGSETAAAPCLHDVTLPPGQLAQAFVDLVVATRAMYQQAKFVHGGLSEFSVLYHNDACWVTDFSSAMDLAHAEHEDGLARDVHFLHSFFQHRGMPKATKHDVGLLNEAAIRELITDEAPARILGAFPWIKPYLYKKK